MPLSLREQFPLRLLIGPEDCTFLLDENFNFSNIDPGGYESASFNVPKDMPQTLRGMPVRIDCGLAVAWEGRVSQIQRSLGHRTAITCEGNGALLKDNDASMVFADRDLTRFIQPSTSRQITLVSASPTNKLGSFQIAPDAASNLPSLAIALPGSYNGIPLVEAWYDSGPLNLIATVYYEQSATAMPNSWVMGISSDADDGGTSDHSEFTTSSTPNSGYVNLSTARRYIHLYANAPNSNNTSNASYLGNFKNMAVYGNHGLTRQGSDPGGFYPSQIAGWVASQVPQLQAGVVPVTDASGYIVAHSVYYTPVGLDQMMNDMAIAAGWHWGVWESLSPLTGNPKPRCDFRPRPGLGQFTAFCRRQDCELCDIREDLSQQYNQAVVTFTTVAGTQGAAVVTADNPILDQAGESRTAILTGGTMTPATAAVYGAEVLAILNAQARVAGTVQINHAIDGPSGPTPPWLLKSGIDRLRVGDLPSFDAWGTYNDVPISRVECSASRAGFQTSVEVGSGGNLVETLNSRVAAATSLAAQGGS